MKFHSLIILFTIVLLAAACGSRQGSEQAAVADRAGTDEQDAKTQELRKIAQVDDAAERIKQLESFIQANSGDPIVTRAQSSLLRALAEEDPKRAIQLADRMLQDTEATPPTGSPIR